MVARDDTVLRGTLITLGVLLLFSIAANVFFWQWGDTQSATASKAEESLTQKNRSLQDTQDQADLMKSMLGVGNATEAERDELIRSMDGDEIMTPIIDRYRTDMALIGQEIDPQNQTYTALPKFFADSLRSKNDVVAQARRDVTQIKQDADNRVANALSAQKVADDAAKAAKLDLAEAQSSFAKEREDAKIRTAEIQDQLTKDTQDHNREVAGLKADLGKTNLQLSSANAIVESQRQEINRLKNDRFEVFQGEVTSVQGRNGGNIVNINLGSSDALRAGVTFGVLDGGAMRPEDADVKATIQVIKVSGQHISQARVVARPGITYPITTGDKVYSPFWSPGRRVKIALVGEIDIDDDGIADNDAIKSQIRSVGADVVEPTVEKGRVVGLDNSVRFLVEGTRAEMVQTADNDLNRRTQEQIENEGTMVAEANNLGVTVIPFWKLEGYLRTIDDSLTTPLGSAARGSDFQPLPALSRSVRGVNSKLPEIFTNQQKGMQQGNRIRP